MATPKIYKIEMSKRGYSETRYYYQSGTLVELVEAYSYTLEVGASYQHESGNSKINRKPKSLKTLLSNLNKAVNNAAADGYAGKYFNEVALDSEER